jgi:hypothetical protein
MSSGLWAACRRHRTLVMSLSAQASMTSSFLPVLIRVPSARSVPRVSVESGDAALALAVAAPAGERRFSAALADDTVRPEDHPRGDVCPGDGRLVGVIGDMTPGDAVFLADRRLAATAHGF